MKKLTEKINNLQEENNRLHKLCISRGSALVTACLMIDELEETVKEAHKNIAAGSGFINNGEVECMCKVCQEDC